MSDDKTAASAAPGKRAYTRLTDAQKTEGTTLYRAGTHTVEEISTKLGGKVETWRKYFVKVGVKKGDLQKEVEAKRAAVIAEALTIDPAVHARRVFDTKNETYRIVEMLRKLTAKVIVEAQRENKPLGSIQNEIKAIREAAAAIKTCREEAFAVLGIRPDEVSDEALPELVISGLDDDMIAQLQESDGADGDDIPEVEVDLGDDDEEADPGAE
jgi:hypothetical protein